jgi:hypothetical protein
MAERPIEVTCPKCGHARRAVDDAPAWQCPACGIAYHKHQAWLAQARARAKQVVVPPRPGEASPPIVVDGSVWSLVAANVLALAIALYQGWPAAMLMLLYWGQSVVIGVSYMLRILSLEKFSTENFKINDRPVRPTPAVKRQVAFFFLFHYGFFHVAYLMFLLIDAHKQGVAFDAWFWGCTAVFALNHLWSYRYNRDLDRRGTPNIGTLMFTPYIRIVPMHLTIIFGSMLPGISLALFGLLKTLADIGMHFVEHGRLKQVAASAD